MEQKNFQDAVDKDSSGLDAASGLIGMKPTPWSGSRNVGPGMVQTDWSKGRDPLGFASTQLQQGPGRGGWAAFGYAKPSPDALLNLATALALEKYRRPVGFVTPGGVVLK